MEVLKNIATDMWTFYGFLFEYADERVEDWFLMDAYWKTWAGVVLYLLIVWIGPQIMKHRQPMKSRYPIVIYNALMIQLNFYIFYELLVCTTIRGYSYSCQPVDYSDNPYEVRIAKALWWFYFSKSLEFMDTFFFILRKKNTQISFLHVYHHATVFPFCWVGVKWVAGGQSFFGAMTNSWIHVMMYSYYGLAALGPRVQKHLWWKPYVTRMQLIQFLADIIHGTQSILLGCRHYDFWMQFCLIFYVAFFLVLFINFYFHTYIRAKHKKSKAEYTNGITNGQALANGSTFHKKKQ